MQSWYISFHGGDADGAWNNIHAFDLNGAALGKRLATDHLPDGIRLRELRGFAFGPDGDLYVANAYRNASQILRFEGSLDSKGRHRFRDVYSAQHHDNPGLAHPFDVSFGPDGHLFVPSQDTNVVGRYFGPRGDGQSGRPMPYPAAFQTQSHKGGDHAPPPGTFVPSRHHEAHGLTAVRGLLFDADGRLYVVDRDANRVNCHDGASGAWLRAFEHPHMSKPVHLLAPAPHRLLVGSRDPSAIFEIDTASGQVSPLVRAGAGGLDGPAGMAIGPDKKLYVCSRESKQILRFDALSGAPDRAPFIDRLSDCPEFIRLVDC